jgi:tRNA-dihydrouridine synthase 3
MDAGALRTLATLAADPTAPAAVDAPPPPPKWQPEPLTADHTARNAALVDRLRGQVILAPLTRGNNLPFRRLCAEFGATVTTSEMGFARQLLKGDPKERTRLRRADNEKFYGVQIATNVIDEGVKAGKMAAEAGADWVDLNCGCPIYEATRRGLGSALLRKPEKLARLVAGIAAELPIPLTVKVRTGQSESSINVQRVVEGLRDAGAAAVTIHGRTALQRYKKPADWSLIEQVAATAGVPVIGNGDVLTHWEAKRRLNDHGCLAVMVGRGALIKPWIFQEIAEGREIEPSAADRVGIYRQLAVYMREYFGDDDKGRRKAFYFLPWHLGFFVRYRPLPETVYGDLSTRQPLISTRWEGVAAAETGETVEGLGPLERLLRCEYEGAWEPMAAALWEADSDAEAVAALEAMGVAEVEGWEEQSRLGDRDREDGGRGRDDRAEG